MAGVLSACLSDRTSQRHSLLGHGLRHHDADWDHKILDEVLELLRSRRPHYYSVTGCSSCLPLEPRHLQLEQKWLSPPIRQKLPRMLSECEFGNSAIPFSVMTS